MQGMNSFSQVDIKRADTGRCIAAFGRNMNARLESTRHLTGNVAGDVQIEPNNAAQPWDNVRKRHCRRVQCPLLNAQWRSMVALAPIVCARSIKGAQIATSLLFSSHNLRSR